MQIATQHGRFIFGGSCPETMITRILSSLVSPFSRHVDLTKAYSALLASLYKTLFNIGARRQAEQEEPNVKVVLTKRERTDVAEDANLLTRMEREVLAEWERRRAMLNVLEMRVEEAVFILRDLDLGGSVDDA